MNDVVADRMALIAEVAERTKEARALKVKKSRERKRLKEEGKKFEKLMSNSRRREVFGDGKKTKKVSAEENINHWTDGNKYANEFYGETMRETQKWDNEWG